MQRTRERSNASILSKLCVLSSLLLLLLPATLQGQPSVGFLMQYAGFSGMVSAIARVNQAMRDCALSPLELKRREAVRTAVAGIAPALIGLAKEYQNKNFSPEYFPFVMSFFGSFVDQTAPEKYKQFLVNPNLHDIPRVGVDFPVDSVAPTAPSGPSGATSQGNDRRNPYAVWRPEVAREIVTDSERDRARVSYDDSEKKNGGTAGVGNYQATLKPKLWSATPAVRLFQFALLSRAAMAEGGGEALAMLAADGGKIISEALMAVAQILFGLAAMIAAAAPMVVAAIQAKADTNIAKINAATQIQLTEITAKTSKDLAVMQKDVALKQSAIAQQISNTNNAAVTDRLQRQLDELARARDDARTAEKERRKLEDSYNQQRILLAKEQADQNLSLAKETLKAQLTQAGLISGFGSSTTSGNALTVASTLGTGSSSISSVGGDIARGVGATSLSSPESFGASSPDRSVAGESEGLRPRAESTPLAPTLLLDGGPATPGNSTPGSSRLGSSAFGRATFGGSARSEAATVYKSPLEDETFFLPKRPAKRLGRSAKGRPLATAAGIASVGDRVRTLLTVEATAP